MKFKMGDYAYQATFGINKKEIVCLECFGKKFITVILGDDSVVTIDCAGCARGFAPPTGKVTIYDHSPRVDMVRIAGMEINEKEVRYKIEKDGIDNDGKWFLYHTSEDEDKLFGSKDLAESFAEELAIEWKEKEENRLKNSKENNKRTWAWNAHYHRGCIRKAEEDLIYHKSKLEVAKLKSKEKEVQNGI